MTDIPASTIAHALAHGTEPSAGQSTWQGKRDRRAAREFLPFGGKFAVGLLRLCATARWSSILPTVGLAVLAAAAAAAWVKPEEAAIWLACELVIIALASQPSFRLLTRPAGGSDQFGSFSAFTEALHGILWAAIALRLGTSGAESARSFALILLMLATAVRATAYPVINAASALALMPMILATLSSLGWSRPSGSAVALAGLACAVQTYFLFLAHKLHKTSAETLSVQAEKDELIAELEQAMASSDLARHRAETANLAKSSFLATVSHELRTPLNAILGFSEVMKGELFGAHAVESYKEYSSDIHASGQHLLMLINEILDLSRIEAGHFELKEAPAALTEIVQGCRHLLRLRASKRHLFIDEAFEPDLPPIFADERAIRQVMLNLLSNAIKFTPQGGMIKIKIGWTTSAGQYVSVCDSGPGIPEEEIPLVLSSFGRGSQAQKNAEEGSGLGLPIAKGLIELHGGSFTLKSKPGEGTQVIVIFPPDRVLWKSRATLPKAKAHRA